MLPAETSELPGTDGASELLELVVASEIPELAEVSTSSEPAEDKTSLHALSIHNYDKSSHKISSDDPCGYTAHKSCCSCVTHVPSVHSHGTPLSRKTDLVPAVSVVVAAN